MLNWYVISPTWKAAHVQGNQPLYSLNLLLHFLTVQLRSLHFSFACIYTIWNRSIRYMLCFRKKLTAIFVNVASGAKYPTRIIVFSPLFIFLLLYHTFYILLCKFRIFKRLAFASLNVSYILFERRRNK